MNFYNYGLLRKSGGTGSTVMAVNDNGNFMNYGGTIEVDSGTLVLGRSGGAGSSNGTFNVAAGAVCDLTGGESPSWSGVMTGSGAGQVQVNNGI